jgi:Signal transduction histidine kinase regulating citrate/malate metabolism
MNLTYYLGYMLFQAINIYTSYRLMRIFYDECKISKKMEVLLYSGFYLALVAMYILVTIPLVFLLANIVFLFGVTYIYQSTLKRRILTVSLIYIIYMAIETVVVIVAGYERLDIIYNNAYAREYYLIASQLFVCIFLYAAMLLLNNYKQIKRGMEITVSHWLVIIVMSIATLYMLLMIFSHNLLDKQQMLTYSAIVFVVNFSVFYLYDMITFNAQNNFEKLLWYKQNQSYQKQFAVMQTSVKSVESMKYDLYNHLLSIQTLHKAGKVEDLQKYLSSLLAADLSGGQCLTTQNAVIDGIMNFKLEESIQYDIEFKQRTCILSDLRMDDIDITILLGCILDNAIEATRRFLKASERWIDLTMKYDGGRLIIICRNACDVAPSFDGSSFKRQKGDYHNHDMGLENVKVIVDKYDGEIYTSYEDAIFEIKIILSFENND